MTALVVEPTLPGQNARKPGESHAMVLRLASTRSRPLVCSSATGFQPVAPVSRSARRVRESNDKHLFGALAHDNSVGKAPQQQPLHAEGARRARQRDKRNDLVLEQVERRIDGPEEVFAEPRPLLFIPRRSLGRLVGRLRVDPQPAHSTAAHARPYALAQLLPVDELRGAGVDLAKAAHDLPVPGRLRVRIGRAVETGYQAVGELGALRLTEAQR